MAINLAEKYSDKVDEAFALAAQTERAVNQDYDWVGVKTVHVYSVPTQALVNYTRSGLSRYGTPNEQEDSLQELTLTRDRSFTFTIDKGNQTEQMMIKRAGESLARQIREQVIPEIDVYRIAAMAAGSGTVVTAAVTKTNAYEVFLDSTVALTDAKAPLVGRIAYVAPAYYKNIKLDNSFIQASEMAQNMLIRGQVGEIDGVAIIPVPTSYLPANTEFITTHSVATTAPNKLIEYMIHENPPGISGWLIEGRVIYDAFVLENKKNAIYLHKSA